MAQPKFPIVVLPVGLAKFCYVNEPQAPYDPKGEPKYKVRVIIEDTPENRAKLDEAVAGAAAAAKKNGVKLKKNFKSPFEYPEDQDEDDFQIEEGKERPKLDEDHVGKIFFEAKSKFQPALIDSQRQSLPDDVKIMGGDVIRIKVETLAYDGFGSGVSLRLMACQLIEKNTSFGERGNSADGFDDVEGGYVAPEADSEGSTEDEEDF